MGLIAEAKLNVLPIPNYSALVNVRYGSFDAALRDAQALIGFGPASIETVDSKVLVAGAERYHLGRRSGFLPGRRGLPAMGVNLVEFVGDTEAGGRGGRCGG